MQRMAATFLFLVVPVACATYGMWRSYVHRRGRDEALYAPLMTVPRPARAPDGIARYTGTTRDHNWIERVVLGGVFGPGPCAVWIEEDGLIFARDRGPVLHLAPILAVGIERGHAAQTAPAGRTLVVRWRHTTAEGAPAELDSGFICGSREETSLFAEQLRKVAQVQT
ncbi:MAG: hypothetical protein M3252_00505 [Actinomycetota bacterium]|nr:hypothetical protein [Actinomycetota bacterium]